MHYLKAKFIPEFIIGAIPFKTVHLSASTVLSQYANVHEKSGLTATQKLTLAVVSLHFSLHSLNTWQSSPKEIIQPVKC